jgi:hypothetical protein
MKQFAIVAMSLFILVSGVADVRRLSHPIGVFGTIANLNGVVLDVAKGSPADQAGIRPGDRYDIAHLAAQDRWFLFPANCTQPGVTLTVGVIRDQQERQVTMTAVTEPMDAPEQAATIANIVAGVIFVLIGTATMLLRPTMIVAGFYLFCLGSAPFPYREFDAGLLMPYSYAWILLLYLIISAGLPGLLIFSVRMLQTSMSGWRLILERYAFAAYLVIASLQTASTVFDYMLGRGAQWMSIARHDLILGLTLVIAIVLVATYAMAMGADRQRIRWVVIGIGIALAAPYVQRFWSGLYVSAPALYDVIPVVGAAAPIAVAYAILKHRVVNVSFFISRTIVYGIITAIVVVAFALIDWLVGRVLDQSRLAVVAEVLVAVAIGFWMNGLHKQIDALVDGVLFRARRAAERALTRFAAGLPFAASFELVDEMLANETAAALGLTSAAVFRRTSGHRFDRMSAVGWSEGTATCLDERDRLVLQLQGERQALRLNEIRWMRTDVPTGPAEPALALPILVRHQVDAIVVLGPHATGEDFDADELRLLSACAIAAGAAYDHLEADALRRRAEEMQRTIDDLRSALLAHGLLPASP